MGKISFGGTDFFEKVLNVLPDTILMVDHDVRIHYANRQAQEMFGDKESYFKRGGSVLRCVNAEEKGCGESEFCKDCAIRQSVNDAVKGEETYKKTVTMNLRNSSFEIEEANMLVTAVPIKMIEKTFALLVLQNISEIIMLREKMEALSGEKA